MITTLRPVCDRGAVGTAPLADAAVNADPGEVAQARPLAIRAPQRHLHHAGFYEVEPVEKGGDLRVAPQHQRGGRPLIHLRAVADSVLRVKISGPVRQRE